MADFEDILLESWKEVLFRYNPLLYNVPRASTEIPTAVFNMQDCSTYVNPIFIANLGENALENCIGVLTHELGHYLYNPETAARAFVQFQIAYSIDKDYYKELYCRWIDAGANLKQMSQEKNGKELRQVYIKLLELGGELDKLMIQLYVRLLPSLFNAEIEEEKFKVDIDKLVKINYSNVAEEEYNMRLFAEVVIPYIKRENVNCSCACS